MNQCHSLSSDETLFACNKKLSNVKIACSYSKEGDICCLEDTLLRLL